MLIFNFHYVDPDIRREDRRHISITPQGLRQVIRTLRAMGMKPVCLRDILAAGGPLPDSKRHVLLTFDDGYENFYEYGVPVLEEEKCPATVFVLPGRFSGTNEWDQGSSPESERDRLMSLEQMQALKNSQYVSIGSHGMMHRNFATLSPEDLKTEIHESYNILSRELGKAFLPVLAYPWGSYSPQVLEAMANSPYKFAFTTEKGHWDANTAPHAIPRYSIFYRDGNPVIFLAKLARNGLVFT